MNTSMNKLVKGIRLLLWMLLPVQGLAQVRAMPLCYWVDDYNIRIHASYYLLGNTLHDAVHYTSGSPEFDLPGIFKYNAIKTSRYKTVKIIEKRRQDNVSLTGKSPLALALYMDTLMEGAQPENTQWLNYDANGYLVRRVIDYYNASPLYSKRDTILYQYQYRGAGSLVKATLVTHSKTVNGNKKPDKEWPYFYASVYCGEIKKGPYTLSSEGRQEYSIDPEGRIVEIRYYYRAFANSCRDYDTDNPTILKFVYNQKGWLVSVAESAIHSGQTRRRETFDYKDISKESVSLFKTPLMEQYLSTIDGPEFALVKHTVESWYRDGGKTYYPIDSPQKIIERYVVMRNEQNALCLSVKVDSNNKPELPTIYTAGKDSVGEFRQMAKV